MLKNKYQAIRTRIRQWRMKMRDQRKVRDDAKLNKHADTFVKAKQKFLSLRAKIKAEKKNLRQVAIGLRQTRATMRDNRSTLEKITGKKQANLHAKPHDIGRLQAQMRKIRERSHKIFNLEYRLARVLAYMRFAKKQKSRMGSVYLQFLKKRAKRLAKRLHRKHKDLMRVLIRKHRTIPAFKRLYTAHAKRVYALSRADEPLAMTRIQKAIVLKLKSKIQALFKKHAKLVGKKNQIRMKIRQAREKINRRKQTKKAAKKKFKSCR